MRLLCLVVIAMCGVVTTSFQPSMRNTLQPRGLYISRSGGRATRQYYSTGTDLPLFPDPTSSLEERMRKLVIETSNDQKKPSQEDSPHAVRGAPHVTQVTNLQDYKTVVADEMDKIVVVRFYASFCRACHAIQGQFYRAGRTYPDVKFVQVPVTADNAALHQGLGVATLPYGHIYHPTAGLVEELRINKRRWSDFDKILQSYNDGECALSMDLDPDTGIYEAPYQRS